MRRLRRHEGLGINRSSEAGGAIVEARQGQIGTHSGLLIRFFGLLWDSHIPTRNSLDILQTLLNGTCSVLDNRPNDR